jgi:hypothetical protein
LVCQSVIPALSSTSVFVFGKVGSSSWTSYWSPISTPTWTNTDLPLSSNFVLWDTPVEIQWDATDISTLTAWDIAGGPSGAVISPPDPSIYPYTSAIQITRSYTDCDFATADCDAILGSGANLGSGGTGSGETGSGGTHTSPKSIAAIVGGVLGGLIVSLIIGFCIIRGRRRRVNRDS